VRVRECMCMSVRGGGAGSGRDGERQLIWCAIRADRSYAHLRIRLEAISKLRTQDPPLPPVRERCCPLSPVPLWMLSPWNIEIWCRLLNGLRHGHLQCQTHGSRLSSLYYADNNAVCIVYRIPEILFILYQRQKMNILYIKCISTIISP
jgi:hypothetical protein